MMPVTTRHAKREGEHFTIDVMASSRGMFPGLIGAHDVEAASAMNKTGGATQSPSKTLSVSSCRTSRCHPAPSAVRIATSFCRPLARVSRRFATLAQAISSTSATDPSSTSNARRTLPTT